MYGIGAILFYPDPQDYGPQLPLNSVRFSSLLTLGEIHEYQVRNAFIYFRLDAILFPDFSCCLMVPTPQIIEHQKQ